MLCVLLTLFKLLDAWIVSRISSKLCFRKSSIAYSFMVLHISTYSRWSLRVLFSIISLHFFIRTLVDYDILGIFCVLVCLAMPVARCWIISVRFLFIVSMPSSSSSSVNLIFSSSWIVFFFVAIIHTTRDVLRLVWPFHGIVQNHIHNRLIWTLNGSFIYYQKPLWGIIYNVSLHPANYAN